MITGGNFTQTNRLHILRQQNKSSILKSDYLPIFGNFEKRL